MWEKLSLLGVTDDLEATYGKRIKLVNRLSMILAAIILPYSLIFLLMAMPRQSAALGTAILLLLGILVLNKYRFYLGARLIIMPVANAVVLYFAFTLGKACNVSVIFFYTAILPWLFFSRKERTYAIAASILSAGLYFFTALFSYEPSVALTPAMAAFFFISGSAVTFAMLVVTIALFRDDSARAKKFLESTNIILQETKKKLQQTHTENEAVLGFAQAMYGNSNSIDDLCNGGLNKLRELFQYTYGAVLIYEKNTDTLKVMAEFGFDSNTERPRTIRNGETLAGDAFKRQKMIRIQDTPEQYWHATSGMGSVKPAELIILPMTFKTQAGVLELAFIKTPDDTTVALLQRISMAFAANILSLVSHEENTTLVSVLKQQKDEISHSYAELEEIRRKADIRMLEQYEAQQTLIRQIIDKGNKKEDELTAQIEVLKKQLQTS